MAPRGTRFSGPEVIELQVKAGGRIAGRAMTDASGNFEMRNVKPGNYRYTAGNPKLGTDSGNIEVKSGETAQIKCTLKPVQKKG